MSDPLKELGQARGTITNPRILFWDKELQNALKREKAFRKHADHAVKIYEGDKRAENSFNILFSNTETLLPACYNQLPRPFVDRRFKDADPLGKLGAQTLERTLSVLEDSGDAEYTPFTDLVEQAVLGALVPGRGTTWFKYDAIITSAAPGEVRLPEDASKAAEDAQQDVSGESVIPTTQEKVKYETICGEDVDYDQLLIGPGREWAKVPWIARFHAMTEADAVESFGKELSGKLDFQSEQKPSSEGWKTQSDDVNQPQGSEPVATVWEIWNKEKKEVVFYAPSYTADLLKVEEDPYGLSGFFPCPEPLVFLLKRSKLTPTPLYTLYEEQAKELNRITTRINKILSALKVRGFYDGSMQGLKGLLDSDDNTLLPASNVAALQAGQNLQNSIWFMPIEVLVAALQNLWQGREEIKDTIYEITGMADIMRGEGAASAPATLQNIKNQWGTLRLKRWQRYVQEYVRDCLRIMGELAGKHFSLETFAQMTDLPFALPEEIQQAQQTVAAIQQQMAMMQQQMGPPPGVPGAPPQQGDPGMPAGTALLPQPSPQMMQAMQEAQAVLAKPKWEEVVGLLRNDMQRYYRIDIETNSTIASDTDQDKQDINEAITAIGQLLNGFLPLAQAGVMPMPTVKSILMTVCRRFNFGREVEDSISQMPDQMPQQPESGPSEAEKGATDAKAQADMQAAQVKMKMTELEGQRMEQDHQFQMAKSAREEEAAKKEHEVKLAEMALKMQEVQMDMALKQQEMQVGMMQSAATLRQTQMQEQVGEAKAKTSVAQAAQAARVIKAKGANGGKRATV